MSQKQKRRRRVRREAKRLSSIFTLERLDIFDYMKIGASLIHDRDACFTKSEEYRKDNDIVRALTWEDKGTRCNNVLLKMNHPAAIQPHEKA